MNHWVADALSASAIATVPQATGLSMIQSQVPQQVSDVADGAPGPVPVGGEADTFSSCASPLQSHDGDTGDLWRSSHPPSQPLPPSALPLPSVLPLVGAAVAEREVGRGVVDTGGGVCSARPVTDSRCVSGGGATGGDVFDQQRTLEHTTPTEGNRKFRICTVYCV